MTIAGQLVYEHMPRLGLSLESLGERLGCTKQAVNLWVHERGIPLYKVPELILLLGIDGDELFTAMSLDYRAWLVEWNTGYKREGLFSKEIEKRMKEAKNKKGAKSAQELLEF